MSADIPGVRKKFWHATTMSEYLYKAANPVAPIIPDKTEEWELVSACIYNDKIYWYWKCEQ
jgi:hypothetical protein